MRNPPHHRARTRASFRAVPIARLAAGAILAAASSAPLVAAPRETIESAMAAALAHHPQIKAEEARAVASRAGIDAARSRYYPRLDASTTLGWGSDPRTGSNGTGASLSDSLSRGGSRWGYGLSATQPLFDGWRTSSAVGEAKANHLAQSATVTSTVQAILLEAAAVYLDLQRDHEIETLHARQLKAISDILAAARARTDRGVGTQTDVAQARARRAQALADVLAARAGAATSRIAFIRTVGREPTTLAPAATPDTRLPASLQTALVRARSENAEPRTAAYRAEAQHHAEQRSRADRLPQVALQGRLDADRALSSQGGIDDRSGATVALRVTAQLYDGGESDARAREAAALRTAYLEEARALRERVDASVEIAWQRLTAGRARLAAERQGIAAAQETVNGIAEEVRMGTRTTLDLLDAQRELTTSRIRARATERDAIFSGYALLAAMGVLSADDTANARSPQLVARQPAMQLGNGAPGAKPPPGWSPAIRRARKP